LTAVAIRRLTIPCDFVRVRDRAAAWIVTGPIGHLWSVLADLAVLLARYGWRRLSSRFIPNG
jgi:hypothetical protein